MARHPDAGKQQRWLDLMRRWHESELTVREFCERHRLSEPNFYLWRRVLRERGLLQHHATLRRRKPVAPAAFVKITLDTEPAAVSAVELVLSDRRLLRVRPGFDAATLLELVRLLEEPAC
jgi:transposase